MHYLCSGTKVHYDRDVMEYKISDLIDINRIHNLLNTFVQANRITTSIIDLEGNILSSTGWLDMCTKFHRTHPELNKKCIESDTILLQKLRKKTGYTIYKCLNGIMHAAMPIIIDKKQIGNLFMGQFFLEPPDIDFFRSQASRYGFDETEYLSALSKIPVIPETKVKDILEFLLDLTELLGEMGLSRIHQLKMNEELHKSEEKYRLLIENQNDLILKLNGQQKIVYASPNYCKTFGKKEEDLWETTVSIMTHININSTPPVVSEIPAEEDYFFQREARMLTINGWRWFDWSVKVIPDNSGNIKEIICVGRDITENKNAELSLYESELLLNEVGTIAKIGGWSIDLTNRKPKWTKGTYDIVEIEYGNKIPGLDEHIVYFLHEFRPLVSKAIRKLIKEHIQFDFEAKLKTAKGNIKWCRAIGRGIWKDGQCIKIYGTFQDISERKKFEDELIKSEKILREKNQFIESIVNLSPDLMFIHDIVEQKNIYTNDALKIILGYSPDELKSMGGRVLTDLMHPDDYQAYLRNIFPKYSKVSDNEFIIHEFRMKHKNGQWIWLECREMIYIRDQDGTPRQSFGVIHDITERAIYEEKLKKAYETASKAEEIANLGSCSWNINNDELAWSDNLCRIHGLEPEQFDKKFDTALKFVHNDDKHIMYEEIERMYAEKTSGKIEYRIITTTGIEKILEATNRLFLNDNSDITDIIVMIQDITERKEAEKALSESEKKYRSLFNGMLNGFALSRMIYDSDNKPVDWVFLDVNDAFVKITGYPKDIIGKRIMEIAPHTKENAPELFEIFGKIASEGPTAKRKKFDIYLKNLKIWLSIIAYSPMKDHFVTVFDDITSSKEFEQALQESEARYRSLVESSTDHLFLLSPTGDFIASNDRVEHLNLEKGSELNGKNINELFTGETLNIFRNKLGQVILTERAVNYEHRIPVQRGKFIYQSITLYPVKRKDALWAIGGISRDITEQKLVDEQLRQLGKMESIGRLAGGIAHDFNNILNIINGYGELAMEEVNSDDPAYEYLAEILKASKRSAELTNQLLAFARKQTIEPAVLDINRIIRNSEKMFRRLLGEDIDFRFLPEKNLWPILMDESQLDQILTNLAVNARDAISNTGTIIVETNNILLDEDYCNIHPGFIPGEYVFISFSDSGIGMDKDTIEHIFEPFYTTKMEGKGTGLGLSTIYGILDQNNGYINVYSEPGQGTTFQIYIPRHEGEVPESTDKKKEPILTGTETIMVVEDEDQILKLSMEILKNLGYKVLTFQKPEQALKYCESNNEEIHLLLTDVVMPVMNGKELKDKIEKIRPGIKTLFMSGYTANVIVHRGVLSENVNFIQKPFSKISLATRVREVLDK